MMSDPFVMIICFSAVIVGGVAAVLGVITTIHGITKKVNIDIIGGVGLVILGLAIVAIVAFSLWLWLGLSTLG